MSVSHSGFRSTEPVYVKLLVGQERILNFKLAVNGRAEQIGITSSVSEIDQTSAVVQGRMVQTQVNGLPLNGRNWSNLLPLMPGATDAGTSDQRSVRFAGHGRDDNNFLSMAWTLTGISNQPQKTQIRLAIPTSAIAEFKVDSTLFTCRFSRGSGGRSPWLLHGAPTCIKPICSNFLRNDVFDARNHFRAPEAAVSPESIRRSFERARSAAKQDVCLYRLRSAPPAAWTKRCTGFTPSATYRSTLPGSIARARAADQCFPAGNVGSDRAIQTIDLFIGLSPQRADETSGMVRFDHRFTDSTAAFLRVNVDEVGHRNPPLSNLRDRRSPTTPINGVLAPCKHSRPRCSTRRRLGFNQVAFRTVNMSRPCRIV